MEGLPQGPRALPALLGSVKGCGGEATCPLTNIPKAPIPQLFSLCQELFRLPCTAPVTGEETQGRARGRSCDRWSSGLPSPEASPGLLSSCAGCLS